MMNTFQNIEWLTVPKHTVSKREGVEQNVNNKKMNMRTSQNIEFKSSIVPKHAASTCEGDKLKTNYKNFKKFRKVCLFSYLSIVDNFIFIILFVYIDILQKL